jgi:hypothetical protein
VPHSQCSLRENPKFLQTFRSENNTLKEQFWLIFLFNICHCNSGLAFISINYYITENNCMYFIRENSQKLSQKRNWALWMRHQCLCATKFQKEKLNSVFWRLARCHHLHYICHLLWTVLYSAEGAMPMFFYRFKFFFKASDKPL